MLLSLSSVLRRHRLPVSTGEWLDLLSALNAGIVFSNTHQFYHLCRLCLVKDERYFDRFDQAFKVFIDGTGAAGLDLSDPVFVAAITEVFSSREALALDEHRLRRLLRDLVATTSDSKNPDKTVPQRMLSEPGQVAGLTREGRSSVSTEDQDAKGLDPVARESPEADGAASAAAETADHGDGDGEGQGEEHGEGEAGESASGEPGQEGDGGQQGTGQSQDTGRGVTADAPEAIGARHHKAALRFGTARKVWEMRADQALDDDAILGVRSLRLALRHLRAWVRQSQIQELDLSETIRQTAAGGGFLDIRMRPERHNGLKLVLLLDSGGSMDAHAEICYQLFSAVKSELKSLSCYRFHNCLYETLAPFDDGVFQPSLSTTTFLSRLDSGTRIIIVGDGQVGLPELLEVGGSLHHYNAATGLEWLARLNDRCRHVAWLNPVPEQMWHQWPSLEVIQSAMAGEMYPLTSAGLIRASKALLR